MKYEVGDKVKIKTWKEMREKKIEISFNPSFIKYMKKDFYKFSPKRRVEILKVYENYYVIKNIHWHFTDNMIKELIKPEPINSRFDILDIR